MAPTPASSTALVTGASKGIGRELTHLLAHHGHRLVLVARNRRQLQDLAAELAGRHAVPIEVFATDLSEAQSPRQLVEELQARAIRVDILVNNAGFAMQGPFAESDLVTQLELLQLNIVSLTHLTRLLLPAMLARRSGRILNVASLAAFVPGPITATYNASKAFVLSFSQALANELRGSGVTVTTLCPGPTRTGFALRAGLSDTKAFRGPLMDASAAAQAAYEGLMRGKALVVPGLRNKLRMLPIRLVPPGILAHFSRRYHEVRPSGRGVAQSTSAPERS